MADERSAGGGVGSRPVDIAGDSPELIAFALLRYLAQLEQQDDTITFDRGWMLDAYAECLEAVQGKRTRGTRAPNARSPKPPSSSGRKRR